MTGADGTGPANGSATPHAGTPGLRRRGPHKCGQVFTRRTPAGAGLQ